MTVRSFLLVAVAFWVAAVALIVLSVAQGGATVSLVVVVPVISGSSTTFLVGVGLLIAGFVALLFAFANGGTKTPTSLSRVGTASPGGGGGAGGFVLIGPVPIVFGTWRGTSRTARWMLALFGAVLLIVVLLAAVWLLR